ncbi:MAG: TIGR03667 family PPOX class F420-dependent oxidoreductase [Acidimicrobiia bacterium]
MRIRPEIETRIAASHLIWLTTVTPGSVPQTSLVWFWWDGESILIYSQPQMPKLANIERNPRVSLNLDAMATGKEEVTIVTGIAAIDEPAPPVSEHAEYREKYRRLIEDELGMTVEQFSKTYSVPIRVIPDSVRAW